jgi:acyl dehydratase
MAVMADGSFPFGAVGLVHVENSIVQHRPIAIGEELKLEVRPTKLQPHPRGRTFSLVTEAWVGDEKVWESVSTMLRRGGGNQEDKGAGKPAGDSRAGAASEAGQTSAASQTSKATGSSASGTAGEVDGELTAGGEWKLGGDLGRRYASVSGDRNPIHMHSLTAKPLGFPGAIAHGMWTKARCLAALESRLPDAFSVDVRFRKPILLPSRVEFLSGEQGTDIAFAVRDAKRQIPHLDGVDRPVEAKQTSGRKAK